jgi:hypothetical protein
MNYIVLTYSLYLIISIALTIWVARTLSKNGRVFLIDRLQQKEALADSVNHLLVVGFYLINFGFISLFLKTGLTVERAQDVFEVLSSKIGIVLLVLGIMHFFNLTIFTIMRRPQADLPPAIPRY